LTAQKLLGHADVKTTLEIYTHLSKEKEAHNIDKLNQFLS
jgi:site-specific recombinase XerD